MGASRWQLFRSVPICSTLDTLILNARSGEVRLKGVRWGGGVGIFLEVQIPDWAARQGLATPGRKVRFVPTCTIFVLRAKLDHFHV